MTDTLHVRPEGVRTEDGSVGVAAVFEQDGHESFRAWFRVPERFGGALADDCDPFAAAAHFVAMRRGADLAVHGRVTPSLLANLQELAGAWSSWLPGMYSRVEVTADEEAEPGGPRPPGAVACFSGGLDSVFTVQRHCFGGAGRQRQDLRAGVFIHGFDIPVDDVDGSDGAARGARAMLDDAGIEMIPMVTNVKDMPVLWGHSLGVTLASCLSMLKGGYSTGLIGSSWKYSVLQFPYGSNPITDRLAGSDSFRVIVDGMPFSRLEKAREVAKWPAARKHLRVCLLSEDHSRNCCRCLKCGITILSFRAAGIEVPEAFPESPSDAEIRAFRFESFRHIEFYSEILAVARQNGMAGESWARALAASFRRSWWSLFRKGTRDKLMEMIRGPRQRRRRHRPTA